MAGGFMVHGNPRSKIEYEYEYDDEYDYSEGERVRFDE
jgi:hypothetical protein